MRNKYPTAWQKWIGQQAIILFGYDRRPVVVHIKSVNKHGYFVANAVNTESTYFPSPLRCIEYSPRLYARLLVLSKYRCAAGEAQQKLDKLKELYAGKHS